MRNPPAFPGTVLDADGKSYSENPGMTLRDYFAAAAMQGFVSKEVPESLLGIANSSYVMADAMLKAREK